MKRLILASVLTVLLTSGTAFADGHGDHKKEGKRQGKFATYDKDGDKNLSKSEYLSMQDSRFDKLDSNDDGLLSRKEMKKERKKAHKKLKDMKSKYEDKTSEE